MHTQNRDIEDHQLAPELASDKCRKSKRRRKLLQSEVACKEEVDVKSENVAEDDYLEQNLLHTDSKKDVSAANVVIKKQIDKLVSNLDCFLFSDFFLQLSLFGISFRIVLRGDACYFLILFYIETLKIEQDIH